MLTPEKENKLFSSHFQTKRGDGCKTASTTKKEATQVAAVLIFKGRFSGRQIIFQCRGKEALNSSMVFESVFLQVEKTEVDFSLKRQKKLPPGHKNLDICPPKSSVTQTVQDNVRRHTQCDQCE